LSMEGRSSWMSDMVCSISMAQAVGIACCALPPTASQAARHRHGRTRLPPASSEYLLARASLLYWVRDILHHHCWRQLLAVRRVGHH
jgi:hypothetical protein